MSGKSALTIKNLSFSYASPARMVLHDIWLEIPSRAITALLGPNGSGKSTLIYLMLGLLAPQSGEILLGDRLHSCHTRQELSRLLGLVPQEEHVTFELSVLEYVLLGRAPYLNLLELPGESDRRIALQAVSTVGLTGLQDRPVSSLSGGERQLAVLARALAQEPEILLLDEPTSHLDLGNTRRILHLLRLLREGGKTILLTTHDPNLAAAVADNVILLREGRVLAAGPICSCLTAENLTVTYDVEVEVIPWRSHSLVITY